MGIKNNIGNKGGQINEKLTNFAKGNYNVTFILVQK